MPDQQLTHEISVVETPKDEPVIVVINQGNDRALQTDTDCQREAVNNVDVLVFGLLVAYHGCRAFSRYDKRGPFQFSQETRALLGVRIAHQQLSVKGAHSCSN